MGMTAAILGAVSAVTQGIAAEKQADFQATVGRQQAASARNVAAASERDFRKSQSANLAMFRAAMGASGVQTGTGSPLMAIGDFAAETELQAQRIRAGGEVTATRLEQQAQLIGSAGDQAFMSSLFGAGASLLTGVSEVDFSGIGSPGATFGTVPFPHT